MSKTCPCFSPDYLRNVSFQTTIDMIAEELHNVSSLCQSYMKNSAVQALNVIGTTSETIDTVVSAMTDIDLLNESLDKGQGGCLSSTNRQAAFLMQNSHFIRPVPLYLGKRSNNKDRFVIMCQSNNLWLACYDTCQLCNSCVSKMKD